MVHTGRYILPTLVPGLHRREKGVHGGCIGWVYQGGHIQGGIYTTLRIVSSHHGRLGTSLRRDSFSSMGG